MVRRSRNGLLIFVNFVFFCSFFHFALTVVEAHNISVSYAEISAEPNQIRWLLRVPVPVLDLLMELDRNHDGKVDLEELQQQSERVRTYFGSHVSVDNKGLPLHPSIGPLTFWEDTGGHPFVQAELVFAPMEQGGKFRLRCDLLQEVITGHQTLATIKEGGKTEEFVFEGNRTYELQGRSRLVAIAQFVHMGMLHIFTGYDHIAFLVGLMLIGGSFLRIIEIVTSFTIAHSITLALAALNAVILPSRLVESGVALSIMYIALENLFFKSFDRRWMVTFFFGLVHGFAFASALRELNLSPGDLGTALFSFNIGVEIGQVCIVALLLPLLWFVGSKMYNRWFVRVASLAIFSLGSVWLYQRLYRG